MAVGGSRRSRPRPAGGRICVRRLAANFPERSETSIPVWRFAVGFQVLGVAHEETCFSPDDDLGPVRGGGHAGASPWLARRLARPLGRSRHRLRSCCRCACGRARGRCLLWPALLWPALRLLWTARRAAGLLCALRLRFTALLGSLVVTRQGPDHHPGLLCERDRSVVRGTPICGSLPWSRNLAWPAGLLAFAWCRCRLAASSTIWPVRSRRRHCCPMTC